ncbi:hypothetical protein PSTH68_04385 [Pseudomonas syringae pv. theae]|uniref:Uncharacterized protein n=1 Tax=Pseudomonas syringae pv. theae TaxID=103985 RepID=A0A3M5MVK3_PSESX|nr:hypothetical protein [Pseudomonas syringae]MBL3872700.1 hypothetical protein [Pseudomonas syringae pv. theae]RMT64159.1 hypothetical protein ALP44_01333 [Pseudomonas syringae pv. theae]GKQ28718.1 hypothetical protein PSTH68_04385 [Pseudomonas syringae pv. theae]
MPLIQIEQDSPETIQAAREQITRLVGQLSKYAPSRDLQYGCQMHTTGYLAALVMHKLISMSVYDKLSAELESVCADTVAESATPAG